MLNKEQVRPWVTSANIKITDRCNFICDHCCLGELKGKPDMTPADMEILLARLKDHPWGEFTLYGGEPRLNRNLEGIVRAIGIAANVKGKELDAKVENPVNLTPFYTKRQKVESKWPRREYNRLRSSCELDVIQTRYFVESDYYKDVPISVEVFTNGFGMVNPQQTAEIMRSLYKDGVCHVTVSFDPPHYRYVSQSGISIDYNFINDVSNFYNEELREKYGVPKRLLVSQGSTGAYVIPVGRAKNYNWGERVKNSGNFLTPLGNAPDEINRIKRNLAYEFDNWPRLKSFSHCYCGVAKLIRKNERAAGYKKENRVHLLSLDINTNLDVNPCALEIVPAKANLKRQTVEEIYQGFINNRLYRILSDEGPSGLAAILTGMPRQTIKDWYIQRTPCGLCEDLMAKYPSEIREMAK